MRSRSASKVLLALLTSLPWIPSRAAAQPATFSVNGPIDPHTEGIGSPRGVFLPAGIPLWAGVRFGPVPMATGLPTMFPGDVADHLAAGIPSEAVMFQSPPIPAAVAPPAAPDGTNNQILTADALGLLPPFVPVVFPGVVFYGDNVDAFSFGEDFIPPGIVTGYAPDGLGDPPVEVAFAPWSLRGSVYNEPIVVDDGAGVAFVFSVDPWGVGLAGTAVDLESGGGDLGAGFGPWTSPGAAAGDVFDTGALMRMGGVTVGGGANLLFHDNPLLALAPAPAPLFPMEDDLDALECVGDNTVPWFAGGVPALPGDLSARVTPVLPFGPAPPGVLANLPTSSAPVFFSVTRDSPGAPMTGVRSQLVIDGGAAADIFVAVADPASGVGTNLLFIDESEIGLYAADAFSPYPTPDDFTDDLDALLLWVCPEYRATVSAILDEILATSGAMGGSLPAGMAWSPYGTDGAYTGLGMTLSVTKYFPPPPGCVRVAFSVTTDSVGLEYTAVDWEAGPVSPAEVFSTAAGDVFYAEVDGSPANTNYLWYDEVDLGLDPGTWVNGASADLVELADNLNGLDSEVDPCPGMVLPLFPGCPGTGGFVPVAAAVGCPTPGNAAFVVTLEDALGGASAALVMATAPTSVPIGGCALLFPILVVLPAVTGGAGPGMGTASLTLPIPATPAIVGATVDFQWGIADFGVPGPLPLAFSNAVEVLIL